MPSELDLSLYRKALGLGLLGAAASGALTHFIARKTPAARLLRSHRDVTDTDHAVSSKLDSVAGIFDDLSRQSYRLGNFASQQGLLDRFGEITNHILDSDGQIMTDFGGSPIDEDRVLRLPRSMSYPVVTREAELSEPSTKTASSLSGASPLARAAFYASLLGGPAAGVGLGLWSAKATNKRDKQVLEDLSRTLSWDYDRDIPYEDTYRNSLKRLKNLRESVITDLKKTNPNWKDLSVPEVVEQPWPLLREN